MKTNTVCAGIILLASQLLFSCSKKTISPQHEKYLQFETIEEYTETLNLVMGMNEEERIVWEKQQGFVSFASHSNQVYETIAEKELPVDELKKEIVPYADYVQLKQEETGDYVLEIFAYSRPDFLLTNQEKIVQIGECFYKFLPNVIFFSKINDIQILLSINSINDIKPEHKNIINIQNNEEKYLKYDGNCSNKLQHIERATNGKNRTKITVEIKTEIRNLPVIEEYYKVYCEVRSYKKTLGIWYHAKRTLSCNIRADVQIPYRDGSQIQILHYTNNGTNAYSIGKTWINWTEYSNNSQLPHFEYIYAWGDSPDTKRAWIHCIDLY